MEMMGMKMINGEAPDDPADEPVHQGGQHQNSQHQQPEMSQTNATDILAATLLNQTQGRENVLFGPGPHHQMQHDRNRGAGQPED